MPKKMGVNTKAETARARHSAAEADRRDRDARAKEEAYWQAAKGPKWPSPAPPAAARRTPRSAPRTAASPSSSSSSLLPPRGAPTARPRASAVPSSPRSPRPSCCTATRRSGSALSTTPRPPRSIGRAPPMRRSTSVLVANTNRDDSIIEARSVEDTIAKMAIVVEPALPPDHHPERRLKVSYKAFEEAELARLKEEKPGLTLHQYKDMIWKLWKKSPDNPLNQVAD